MTRRRSTDLEAAPTTRDLIARLEDAREQLFRKLDAMTAEQLNDLYEDVVGYRPQADDPAMTDAYLLSLVKSYVTAYDD